MPRPAARTFGNAGVGNVRGPGMKRLDFSLHKQFNLTENGTSNCEQRRSICSILRSSPARLHRPSLPPLFGQIRSSQGERNVELAAKFYF